MADKNKWFYPVREAGNPKNVTLKEISEEVYRRIYPEIWRIQKEMRRLGRCVCPKHKLCTCDADCLICEFQASGNQISLDTPIEGTDGCTIADTITVPSRSPESIIIDMAMMDALIQELEQLDPEGRLMCKLYMNGYSEREAAKKTGTPRSTYKLHWGKVKDRLYEKLKDWED